MILKYSFLNQRCPAHIFVLRDVDKSEKISFYKKLKAFLDIKPELVTVPSNIFVSQHYFIAFEVKNANIYKFTFECLKEIF